MLPVAIRMLQFLNNKTSHLIMTYDFVSWYLQSFSSLNYYSHFAIITHSITPLSLISCSYYYSDWKRNLKVKENGSKWRSNEWHDAEVFHFLKQPSIPQFIPSQMRARHHQHQNPRTCPISPTPTRTRSLSQLRQWRCWYSKTY